MPLFEYKCTDCGSKFEVLVNDPKQVGETTECMNCGKEAVRQVSQFSHKTSGGSSNESVDMTIGRAAENRWQSYYDKQGKRHKKMSEIKIDQPKSNEGNFMPVMALGSKEERQKRKDYSSALKEHRSERVKKGQGQFDGPGVF